MTLYIIVREEGETPTRAFRTQSNDPLERAVELALFTRYGELAKCRWDMSDAGGPKAPGTYSARVEPFALLERRVVVTVNEQGELFGGR